MRHLRIGGQIAHKCGGAVGIGMSALIDIPLSGKQHLLDFDILISLGLCRRINERLSLTSFPSDYEVHIGYHLITELGNAFLSCCSPEIYSDAKARNELRPGMKAGFPPSSPFA
jgi:hypothetical protein